MKFIMCTLLLKLCMFSHNEYWNHVFQSLFKNMKYEYSFISYNKLYYSKYNNIQNSCFITIPLKYKEKDVQSIYNNMFSFLKTKIGKDSNNKNERLKELFYIQKKEIFRYKDWKSITKKNEIEFYIEKYLINYGKKYNIDKKIMFDVKNLIFLPNNFKKISKKIVFCQKSNKIVDIENFYLVLENFENPNFFKTNKTNLL